jgi:hypothetical protein
VTAVQGFRKLDAELVDLCKAKDWQVRPYFYKSLHGFFFRLRSQANPLKGLAAGFQRERLVFYLEGLQVKDHLWYSV